MDCRIDLWNILASIAWFCLGLLWEWCYLLTLKESKRLDQRLDLADCMVSWHPFSRMPIGPLWICLTTICSSYVLALSEKCFLYFCMFSQSSCSDDPGLVGYYKSSSQLTGWAVLSLNRAAQSERSPPRSSGLQMAFKWGLQMALW